MIKVKSFNRDYSKEWDQIVKDADNGHFMFERNFMEYHAERFEDKSFIVCKNDKLIGVIPGNKKGIEWQSHGGLTFGGLIILHKYNRINDIIDIYDCLIKKLKKSGFKTAVIKPIPWIYHKLPCEGELYCLSKYGISENQIQLTTTLPLFNTPIVSNLRKRMSRKAEDKGIVIRKCDDFKIFWKVLAKRLNEKYNEQPTHSCEELEMLAQNFPLNIFLFCAFDKNVDFLGGSIIFATDTVWHTQYTTSTEIGRHSGALDKLFLELTKEARKAGKTYLDFGISNEKNGNYLNTNLARFKEGFGARSVTHNKVSIKL